MCVMFHERSFSSASGDHRPTSAIERAPRSVPPSTDAPPSLEWWRVGRRQRAVLGRYTVRLDGADGRLARRLVKVRAANAEEAD